MMKEEVHTIMFNKASYFIRQGLRNISGHRAMSLASICIVAASLMLLGIFTAQGINISNAMGRLEESREINVYLSSNAGGRPIEDIENELGAIAGVDEVRFYSREDRLQSVIDEVYGEDGYIFAGDQNPLRDSYIITVGNAEAADSVCSKVMEIQGVEEIVRSSDIISGIDALTSGMKNIYIWITVLFLLIAIFIISNTIKLGISARRDEIEVMKTVGATNSFILMPFLFEAFILGLIGAVIAEMAVVCGYIIITGRAGAMISADIFSFAAVSELTAVTVPLFLLTGVIIGVVGSVPAVRKYLK